MSLASSHGHLKYYTACSKVPYLRNIIFVILIHLNAVFCKNNLKENFNLIANMSDKLLLKMNSILLLYKLTFNGHNFYFDT